MKAYHQITIAILMLIAVPISAMLHEGVHWFQAELSPGVEPIRYDVNLQTFAFHTYYNITNSQLAGDYGSSVQNSFREGIAYLVQFGFLLFVFVYLVDRLHHRRWF